MEIFVIMPHYIVNEEVKQLAINAIESFKKSAKCTLISIDDCSPYDSGFLKEMSDVYIRNETNKGFAPTCNIGFKKAFELCKEDDCYIICANNDIEVHYRAINELLKPFKTIDNVAITGIISTKERTYDGKPLPDVDTHKLTEGGLIGDRMQDGGYWGSTKKVLEKIGLFDEQFLKGGFEDFDLFIRARDTFGMKIIMSGRAVYWHKQGATRWSTTLKQSLKAEEELNYAKFKAKWNKDPRQEQMWYEKIIY